ncbi:retrotransposon-related protein [Tanacetum coccineum]
MPFGLTNAPSTFQSLMNEVFRQFLRKFTLVFFDDILVYNPTKESHKEHLRLVLQTTRINKLYAKKSKCIFGSNHVEYVSHIISDKRVAIDPDKIEPLTDLLKKKAFKWCDSAQGAFEDLKEAMVSAPVLQMPDFEDVFVVETDASGLGIRAMLQQNGHPIAFTSKTLSPKHQSLSTYEKELLAVIQALDKWRGYLLDRHFIIKTDYFRLKYLMDQRFTTPAQVKWLPKLMGFDYEISYKKGSENVAVDALSRLSNAGELLQMVATSLTADVYQRIVNGWLTDDKIKGIIQGLQTGTKITKHYEWSSQQLLKKGKLFIGEDSQLKHELFKHFYEGSQGGHSGVQATLKRMKLLQPLPIPKKVWTHISMDFVDGLPMSKGKSVLQVVVDRLSKYGHFIPLTHPYLAISVAQAFLDNVYKLHGLPKVIVSDRDTIFLSRFWIELFKLLQVNLHMSSAYHPQTDGQTEVVNRCVECYLRFLYGQAPPAHITYKARDSANDLVDRLMVAREAVVQLLKFHLQRAQERMKVMADKKRTKRVFAIDDLVLLKLQPYRQSTLRQHKHRKLAPKYYGPFKIVARWSNEGVDDATWELYEDIAMRFPAFDLNP